MIKNACDHLCSYLSASRRPTIYRTILRVAAFKGALLVLLGAITFASTLAQAQLKPAPNDTRDASKSQIDLLKHRKNYNLAKKYLARSDIRSFKKHQKKAKDYVLAPYLEYAYLKHTLDSLPTKRVRKFLEKNQGSFLASALRTKWLDALARKKQWKQYVAFYEPDNRSIAARCHHIFARVKTGDSQALDEVPSIWVSASSRPKSCDPLFSAWMAADKLTDEIAWQRYKLAIAKNKRSLARYVSSRMSDKYKPYAKLFSKVHSSPYTIRTHTLFTEQSSPMRDIISHGITRYARHNPQDAAAQWTRFESQQLFESTSVVRIKASIIKQLAKKNQTDLAKKWIQSSQELRVEKVIQPLIHKALQAQEWRDVSFWIAQLKPADRDKQSWKYWQARALVELSKDKVLPSEAVSVFELLSQNRSFYGFLSADILNQAYNLQHKTVSVSENAIADVQDITGIKRAKELWLTNKLPEAQAEWQYTMNALSDEELLAAGEVAKSWGQHNQAIRTMIFGKQWDMLDLRFPLAYQEEINTVASRVNLQPTMIFAIARQESAFLENARSPVGARGLMQLMPATAKETASKSGIEHRTKDLYTAKHNILLGSSYLKGLLNKYQNNVALAAAAYNAGPHRVDTWLKDRPASLPADIWIETIPFKETRGYVKNVLAYKVIYAYRLGDKDLKIRTTLPSKNPVL